MGGIPWQSKGCRTCRRRKIKCDGLQPACGRCIKRGIECPGYQKTHIFNVHQETFRQGKKTSPHELVRQDNLELDSLIFRCPSPVAVINTASVSREQIFSVFLDHYFPNDHSGSPYGVNLWHYLITSFFDLPQKTHMLETAITAISCVYLGKSKNDSQVLRYGLQLYNRAIQDMSNMICRNTYTDDIIYTTVIFQEIENCHCPQGFQTWLAHIAGTNAIMKHYQHIRSDNSIINAIYDQWQKFRIICLTMGRDLSDEEYKYCREPSEGRPLVELINIFADFTPLSAGIDSVDQSNHQACQKLLDACLAQRNRLQEWYAQRKETIGGGPLISIDRFCCTDIDPVNGIFGSPYSFVSLDNAMLHVFYWIAMVIVSPMIYRAKTFVRSLEHGNKFCGDYVSDPDYLRVSIFADEIVRAVPVFAQDKNKLVGPHMVMFGVAAACKAYINLGAFKKLDWCEKTLGSFGERGFESCLHYRGYACDYWGPMNSCTADPFLPVSVRNELKSGSPSFDQVSDMSGYGQSPLSNCVQWVSPEKDLGNYMLENFLLEDFWQRMTMCCVSTR